MMLTASRGNLALDWKQQMSIGLDYWIQLCSKEQKYVSIKEQIMELREDIENELTIMIVGEFKAGKSTFINALLGEKVLSSDVTPETAMVTKLVYGKKRKVIAHYLNGDSEVYDDAYFEQLTAERDGKFKAIRHQLSHVELQMPFEILKTFTIIDTPGLNANNEFHTKATERFLGRTDYAIFLFHAMNVGTATEIKWLKKFNENSIYPFGIINRIDELDEEEDDLEDLIDFNKPRLGPSVQKLIGVSARDALIGKLEKNTQTIEWSNWGDVERLLESFKEETNKKLERTYTRLLQPIRQMDQLYLERKISLPLKKLNTRNVESFVTREFPELFLTKERLDSQKKLTKSVQDKWNVFFDTKIYTIDSLDGFLRSFMQYYKKLGDQRGAELKSNPLQIWEKMILPKYHSFLENRKEYNNKVIVLNQDRENLDRNWKTVQFSSSINKKKKLRRHGRKLEFYHHERGNLGKKRKVLTDIFREMTIGINEIQQSINTFVESDLQSHVENERKELDSWNRQIKKAKNSFDGFSRSDLTHIELFSKGLDDFQENVAVPLLNAGRTLENLLVYEEVNYLFSNLEQLGHDLPPKEFYHQWKMMDVSSKVRERNYNLNISKIISPELLHHELKVLPDELKHDVQIEIDIVRAELNRWMKSSVAAMFLLLVIVGIAELNDRSSSQHSDNNISDYKDSDYSENVADAAPSLEEEKQTLENQYSEEDVKSFLRSVYQQLKYDQSSHFRLFSNDGWERFLPYYDNLAKGKLETFNITNVEYLSGDEIKATVKETAIQSGSLKEFETDYTLTMDSNAGNNLMISAFSYTLANETETEIALEDRELKEFFSKFRSEYMQVLNWGNSVYIADFFDQGSPAYKELQTYINSIAGKGYTFKELGFQIDKVNKVNVNEYSVSTSEKYMFTDEKGEKTNYEKTKNYIVKVLPEKRIVIKEITINNTKKEVVKMPTVQLVTTQDVNGFIHRYYSAFEGAFNGNGFSYVQDYYDPKGSGYKSTEEYIKNANNKNMRMNNIEKSVESISTVDENHYIVIVNFIDEYAYRDGSGDRKRVRTTYKVSVSNNGNMLISEDPKVEILEKTKY
ncbi:Bacterial dynamin-like protein [Bacillus mobilis]|uniref:Bacterial dynamin-like protein n=1 Tax=Bacillus mobilis TaxID=2026190 RepID=A0A1Y6A3E5_9BACI|nr:Bacterial dynamin-like protein [Bacillus mobilis]